MGRTVLGPAPVGRATARLSRSALVPVLACAVALVVLLGAFVAEPFAVPTGSMAPTLRSGDHVLVNKLAYRSAEPRRRGA